MDQKIATTPSELRRLQLNELEILLEMKRICEKYQLQYYLVGGTLLGAVRHKGFIPWDDDIDVAMPREDYERFAELCKTELKSDLFYQCPQTDKDYYLTYAKIRKNNSFFYEERFQDAQFHKGVFIDILPLDKCPKPGWLCHFLFNTLAVMNYRGQVDSGERYVPYKELIGKIGYGLLRFLDKQQIVSLRKKLVAFSEKRKDTNYIASYSGAYGYPKEIFPQKWFGQGKDILFENNFFKAPCEYEQQLSQVYGTDYMEMPSEKHRKKHCDLDKCIF